MYTVFGSLCIGYDLEYGVETFAPVLEVVHPEGLVNFIKKSRCIWTKKERMKERRI